jgi:hypothetical protein
VFVQPLATLPGRLGCQHHKQLQPRPDTRYHASQFHAMMLFPVFTTKHWAVWSALILGFLASSSLSIPINANASVQCVWRTWEDLFVFFTTNYVAHAMSVPSLAGARWHDTLLWAALALFLPFAGLGRSISLITRHILWRTDALHEALASEAVAVVGRTESWKPPEQKEHEQEQVVQVKLPTKFLDLKESYVAKPFNIQHNEADSFVCVVGRQQ